MTEGVGYCSWRGYVSGLWTWGDATGCNIGGLTMNALDQYKKEEVRRAALLIFMVALAAALGVLMWLN